jgi:hypothetical protein
VKLSFYGSSLLSSYWNGAATYYRGLLRGPPPPASRRASPGRRSPRPSRAGRCRGGSGGRRREFLRFEPAVVVLERRRHLLPGAAARPRRTRLPHAGTSWGAGSRKAATRASSSSTRWRQVWRARIVAGSSLLSSYWNGAATYYRGLLRDLAGRGYRITFYDDSRLEP